MVQTSLNSLNSIGNQPENIAVTLGAGTSSTTVCFVTIEDYAMIASCSDPHTVSTSVRLLSSADPRAHTAFVIHEDGIVVGVESFSSMDCHVGMLKSVHSPRSVALHVDDDDPLSNIHIDNVWLRTKEEVLSSCIFYAGKRHANKLVVTSPLANHFLVAFYEALYWSIAVDHDINPDDAADRFHSDMHHWWQNCLGFVRD